MRCGILGIRMIGLRGRDRSMLRAIVRRGSGSVSGVVGAWIRFRRQDGEPWSVKGMAAPT